MKHTFPLAHWCFALVLSTCMLPNDLFASGSTCDDPTLIPSIPFNRVGLTTEGSGDDYSISPCDDNYMGGDDYVFSYTPVGDEYVTIRLENVSAWTGLHLLDACPDVATQCIGSDIESGPGIREIKDVKLNAGQQYFIVVSTFPQPQFTDFDIHVLAGIAPPPGTDCSNAQTISSLPFSDQNRSTELYGNTYSGTGPCAAPNENYLNGNDIVYTYTPAENESITLQLSDIQEFFTGVQILDACPDSDPNCVGSAFNAVKKEDLLIEHVYLDKDITYYIVISTWETPPTTVFDLLIESNRICPAPVDLSLESNARTSARISYAGSGTSYEVEVVASGEQPGSNMIRTTEGQHTFTGLSPDKLYDAYVRSNCEPASLIITGVFDGPLSGGNPKGVELYALFDIPNLGQYAIGSANNGDGSDGPEFMFPSMSVPAGTFVYWVSDQALFKDFFGVEAQFEDSDALINGNDAVELFFGTQVIDQFGDVNTDGTGTSWEYKDGWAYRRSGQENNNSAFDPSKWIYSGVDELEGGPTNQSCDTPFLLGSFQPSPTLRSAWTGPLTFNTLPPAPVCGGFYYDNGGTVATYSSESNDTITICPDNPGFIVEINFTSFEVEADDNGCIDGLYIYDSNTAGENQMNAPNGTDGAWCWVEDPSGSKGSGDLSGQTISANNQSGCLTFVFRSDAAGSHKGWSAGVGCRALQDCSDVSDLSVSDLTSNSALLSWTVNSSKAVDATLSWGSVGFDPDQGTIINGLGSSPYLLDQLMASGVYEFYVRQNCGAFGTGNWVGPQRFITSCSSDVGNEIANAIEIGQLPYAHISSTADCYDHTIGHPSADAVYAFTSGDCMYSIRASTCSELTDFDTVIRLLDSLGNEVTFNDDADGDACNLSIDNYLRLSILETRIQPNTKYFLLVEGFGTIEGTYEITLEEGSLPAMEIETMTDHNDCYGDASGNIQLDVMGGKAPLTYQWSTGQNEPIINDLIAGIYTITVSDQCNNESILDVEILENEEITIDPEIQNESDFGKEDGYIKLTIDGGEMPYTYQWSTGSDSRHLANLSEGQYCVTITDAIGCTQSRCFDVLGGVVSVRSLDEIELLELQPNPSSDVAFLKLEFTQTVDLELSIVNSVGQLMWKLNDRQVKEKTYQLDVRDFPAGVYFVQVNYLNYAVTHKIVVSR